MENIGIIGSGAMGSGIAQVAASAGHKVLVYDSDPIAAARAESELQNNLNRLVEKGKMTENQSTDIFGRIAFVDHINKFRECSLVIEAIIENLEIKKKVFAELENIIPVECILGTNTSSLSVTSIAAACNHPERIVGIHFFNPAPVMPLVEIIPAIQTKSDVVENAKKLVNSWGKVTVLCKDTPGFIVNRVARSFYGEAIRMMEEGIADMATIDWAMKEIGGFKMGPFELMDFIGHDVNYKVTEIVWEQFFYDPRFKPSLSQKRLYEAGHFGKKTGVGFYNYTDNIKKQEPQKDQQLGKVIFMRIIAMLINEAADALYLGIASRDDLDLAMIKGVNYPKGLLKWGDELDLNVIFDTLQELYLQYAEDRYRPSILLRKMVLNKEQFYN